MTSQITSTAFKMQPCIFFVFRSLNLVFEWANFWITFFLFSKNVFLIFEPVFLYILSWTIIYYVSQIFSYWCTCFFHCTKTVSNSVYEVILITLSRLRIIIIMVTQYPFKQSENILKNITVLLYTNFYDISLNTLRRTFVSIYNFFMFSKYR